MTRKRVNAWAGYSLVFFWGFAFGLSIFYLAGQAFAQIPTPEEIAAQRERRSALLADAVVNGGHPYTADLILTARAMTSTDTEFRQALMRIATFLDDDMTTPAMPLRIRRGLETGDLPIRAARIMAAARDVRLVERIAETAMDATERQARLQAERDELNAITATATPTPLPSVKLPEPIRFRGDGTESVLPNYKFDVTGEWVDPVIWIVDDSPPTELFESTLGPDGELILKIWLDRIKATFDIPSRTPK